MKTIYLVRHGKAQQRDLAIPDFKRSLVRKGKNETIEIAKKLKKTGVAPDLLISSPAKRAIETCHIYANIFNYKKKAIILEQRIYDENSESAIFEIIKNIEDKYNEVMLFGHDPGFSECASMLLRNFNYTIPKSGVVGAEFSKSWDKIIRLNGKLKLFTFPMNKEMKNKYQENFHKKLSDQLHTQISNTLAKIDSNTSNNIDVVIHDSSKELVKLFMKKRGMYIFRSYGEIKTIITENNVTMTSKTTENQNSSSTKPGQKKEQQNRVKPTEGKKTTVKTSKKVKESPKADEPV